jgi:hypothetical protein
MSGGCALTCCLELVAYNPDLPYFYIMALRADLAPWIM